jgi:MFS family permease
MTEIKQNLDIKWIEPKTIWNKLFLSVFFANMIFGLGQMMSNSMLSVYADSLGTPDSQIGMLMGMFALTALIFRFVAGPALDSFNRKYLLLFSTIIMSISYIGFSFSKTIGFLMLFRLLQGVGNAFGNVCCFAIVADALPRKHFSKGIGYYSIAQVVSQAIGPAIGLFLVSKFGYSNTYILNACVMFLATLTTALMHLPQRMYKKFSMKYENIIAKEALVPTAITFFVAMGFTTINALLIVAASKEGVVEGIGLFFTVYALTMLITRPVIGQLTDKFGFVKVSIPSILMTALSFVVISQAHTLNMFLFAAFINAFGYGAVQPALQSLVMKSVTADRRGSATSTNYIGMDLATLIGPTFAGIVAEIFGYSMMWVVMIIPLLIGVTVALLFRKKINHIEELFEFNSN